LPDGSPLLDATTYSITGCTRPDDFLTGSDVLCSYPGFTNVAGITNAATGSPYTVHEMFIDLMAPAAGGNAIVPWPNGTNHHTDVSNTAVWPQTPFVQPLW